MDVLFCGLNSSFSHVNIAVRYFERIFKSAGVSAEVYENTVTQPYHALLSALYERKAEIYCFSCYLWNITLVMELSRDLKKLRPDAAIILGGPEVSYEAEEYLTGDIDFIIRGEGEEGLLSYCREILAYGLKKALEKLPRASEYFVLSDLEKLPDIYEDIPMENRLVYYEGSRGCPFSCTYCLSSEEKSLRFRDEGKIISDMKLLSERGAKVIKLLDRTFNADRERAKRLWSELSKIDGATFHFEICADLLDDESIELLSNVEKGRFQMEIGIQTVNPVSAKEIKRAGDLLRGLSNLERLKKAGNIHLHTDLIAALPFDKKEDVLSGIDMLFPVSHKIQLGFLKLLRGTHMRRNAGSYGLISSNKPPYEVWESRDMPASDLFYLKEIAWILDHYHETGNFTYCMEFILNEIGIRPSEFLCAFRNFLKPMDFFASPKGFSALMSGLREFIMENMPSYYNGFLNAALIDFFKKERKIPPFADAEVLKDPQRLHELFSDNEFLTRFIPKWRGERSSRILKDVVLVAANNGSKKILLFDFRYGEVHDIIHFLKAK